MCQNMGLSGQKWCHGTTFGTTLGTCINAKIGATAPCLAPLLALIAQMHHLKEQNLAKGDLHHAHEEACSEYKGWGSQEGGGCAQEASGQAGHLQLQFGNQPFS